MSSKSKISLSKLDWSAIYLFSRVKDKLIDQIIQRWVKSIENNNSEILRWNIIAGFCNLYEMFNSKIVFENDEKLYIDNLLHEELRNTEVFDKNLTNSNNKIIELLNKKGHLLFNFYLYKIIDAFGEKNLNPIILGFDHIKESNDLYNTIYSNLNSSKIPFRVFSYDKYLETYKDQLLPINGGLTPFYTLQNFMSEEALKPYNVDNFLLHLSILHKREDYIQGHFSALIKTIENHKEFESLDKTYPIFTSVLTSILPDAFNEDDVKLFEKTVSEIENLGSFSEFTKLSSIQSFLIKNQTIRSDKQLNNLNNDNLNNDYINIFKKDFNNNLIYTYNEVSEIKKTLNKNSKSIHLLTSFALNINSIENIVNKLFPSGPWFDTNIFYENESNDYNKLIKYLTLLERLFKSKETINLNDFAPANKFFNIIFPEIKSYSKIFSYRKNEYFYNQNQRFELIFFFKKECDRNKNWKKEIEHIKSIFKRAIKEESSALEGKNPKLLNILQHWISYNYDNEEVIEFKYEPLNLVISKDFLKSIRAIFILKNSSIYIPINVNREDSYFNNYQEFWTFQKTLAKIFNSSTKLEEFSKYSNTAKYLYKYNNKIIKIIFCKNSKKNTQLKKALLYYGIEVGEVEYSNVKVPRIELTINGEMEPYENFGKFYSRYLEYQLNSSKDSKIIESIFRKNIDSISIDMNRDNEINVTIENNNEYEVSTWKEYRMLEPEAVFINYINLNNSYRDANLGFQVKCKSCGLLECKTLTNRWDFNKNIQLDKQIFCKIAKKIHGIYVYEHRNEIGSYLAKKRKDASNIAENYKGITK